MNRLVVVAAALAALLPRLALACPYCAVNRGEGLTRALLVVAFISVPYAVVALVIRAIRHADD